MNKKEFELFGAVGKLEFPKEMVEGFIKYDWETRSWIGRLFGKKLTFKEACAYLFEARVKGR